MSPYGQPAWPALPALCLSGVLLDLKRQCTHVVVKLGAMTTVTEGEEPQTAEALSGLNEEDVNHFSSAAGHSLT